MVRTVPVTMISEAEKRGDKDTLSNAAGNQILEGIESRQDCEVEGHST